MMKPLKILLVCAIIVFPAVAQTNHRVTTLTDLQCLTANIFYEARGEKPRGQLAVADVTKNRVQSKKYPKSICAVVFQRKQFSWTHQQSWSNIQKIMTGSVVGFRLKDRQAYYKAKIIAQEAIKDSVRVLPEDSLHYHAAYITPKWANKMKKYARIGSHIFYRG